MMDDLFIWLRSLTIPLLLAFGGWVISVERRLSVLSTLQESLSEVSKSATRIETRLDSIIKHLLDKH